jgi:hypothetical protein
MGTALMLFAVAIYLEPHVYKRIREATRFTDLQKQGRDLADAKRVKHDISRTRKVLIDESLRTTGLLICESGFQQIGVQHIEGSFVLNFEFPLSEPKVRWNIGWEHETSSLNHEVLIQDVQLMALRDFITYDGEVASAADMISIRRFEERVGELLPFVLGYLSEN